MPVVVQPAVTLKPFTEGREVLEDYDHTGLPLRRHAVGFLRADLAHRGMVACAEAMAGRNRQFINLAGLVPVRQMPGSAHGVLFITAEDETGIANLVVWPNLFEAHRRIVLGSTMLGVAGTVQREGEVVHIIVRKLHNLSGLLASPCLKCIILAIGADQKKPATADRAG